MKFALAFAFIGTTLGAERLITPQTPLTGNFSCRSTEVCPAAMSLKDGTNCQAEELNWAFEIKGDGKAVIIHPNAGRSGGSAQLYDRYGVAPYHVITTGDGSATTMLTLLPDNSFILTSHLTLQRNVALTHFGFCEEAE